MALSTEKRHLKRLFMKANEKTPEAEKVQKYLQEVHSVNTPEDFAVKLTLAHHDFRGAPFQMSLDIVDAIVEACGHWRDYVTEWDTLVCGELITMAHIHTSVINWYFLKGVPLKKQPSFYRETTVTSEGVVRFCDR